MSYMNTTAIGGVGQRKPLATKRHQRPSPAYNSPAAEYLHNQLSNGNKKVSGSHAKSKVTTFSHHRLMG